MFGKETGPVVAQMRLCFDWKINFTVKGRMETNEHCTYLSKPFLRAVILRFESFQGISSGIFSALNRAHNSQPGAAIPDVAVGEGSTRNVGTATNSHAQRHPGIRVKIFTPHYPSIQSSATTFS